LHFAQFAEHFEIIQTQRARRDKVKRLSRFFGRLDTSELPAAIYLCQGRLAEPYRPRRTDHIRMSYKQVSSLMREPPRHHEVASPPIHDDPHPNLPTDVLLDSLPSLYNALHASLSRLDAWLSRQQLMPIWLADVSRQMTEQEMECFSRILTGPLLKDEVIISALAHFVPSVVGVEEALQEVYKYTVPDLGAVKAPRERR
jgi:hypothetical protein